MVIVSGFPHAALVRVVVVVASESFVVLIMTTPPGVGVSVIVTA